MTPTELNTYIKAKTEKETHKRYKHEFTCNYCGEKYTLMLSKIKYQQRLSEKVIPCCPKCNSRGINLKVNKRTEEHKQHISEAAKGRKWMTNGIEKYQIHPEHFQKYLDKGFWFGYK